MKSRYTIGTRGSRLALWQAEWAKNALETAFPDLIFQIEIIKTSGDSMRDVSLSVIGGQGVFIKELEDSLINERVDIAVHSLKDLPTTIPDQLCIAAITEREDPRDALVLCSAKRLTTKTLRKLPPDKVVGTSSPRRLAQLKHLCPERVVKDLRGNVDSRLRKLDAGWYDAIILAAAGLRRLGWEERISAYLEPSEMLPAIGQGALAIETRAQDEDAKELVMALNHSPTHAACVAERALLRGLGGGCQLPIAGHASVKADNLQLEGLVITLDGKEVVRESIGGPISDPENLGIELSKRLLARGAASLLAST